jgi:2-C-methyl-D-erythritol 4-phosphate cytidylyltransferase
MRVVAAVLAAGQGTRYGADKIMLPLRGEPVWHHSFSTLLNHPEVDEVGVVCSAFNLDVISAAASGAKFVTIGGATRPESARIACRMRRGPSLLRA